ncbi:MAG TPA: hypothetical protein VMA72_26655, partial [Streptosporangiaceae bacterium]|nr:hypothetical protein [Streptosporangiaceae bacterium]
MPLPDLRAGNIDAKIRTQGGARIGDDTPPHHPAAITTQAGPESVKKNRRAGASSGDHTHVLVQRQFKQVGQVPAHAAAGVIYLSLEQRRPATRVCVFQAADLVQSFYAIVSARAGEHRQPLVCFLAERPEYPSDLPEIWRPVSH